MLGLADVATCGRDLTALADAAYDVAPRDLDSDRPFAVFAMGRFGGSELSYASDLDVFCRLRRARAPTRPEAERTAEALMRYLIGEATPANRLWTVDVDLRPEGRQGPLSRSVAAYAAY